MKILTLGDSWTYGEESSDPATMSWPAQMARRYNVQVVNLARSGSSNQRAARIGIEELARDSSYDYVIFPLAPASRSEILKTGKWHQIWPNHDNDVLDKVYTEFWHPWNDVQNTILLSFYFIHSVHSLGIPLYITGLSLSPKQYAQELSWITDYKNNDDFNALGMPLDDFDIGTRDLDRKLKSLTAIHNKNLKLQPEYLNDVIFDYFKQKHTQEKYGYSYNSQKHPNDAGYSALADYFANKIGLVK
jgi:hypothetical protein